VSRVWIPEQAESARPRPSLPPPLRRRPCSFVPLSSITEKRDSTEKPDPGYGGWERRQTRGGRLSADRKQEIRGLANEYDVVVIGSGTGGYVAAIRARAARLAHGVRRTRAHPRRHPVSTGDASRPRHCSRHAHAAQDRAGLEGVGPDESARRPHRPRYEPGAGLARDKIVKRSDRRASSSCSARTRSTGSREGGRLAGKGQVDINGRPRSKMLVGAQGNQSSPTGSQPRSVPRRYENRSQAHHYERRKRSD